MRTRFVFALVLTLAASSCGDEVEDIDESTASAASTGAGEIPVSPAGESSASGPGVPEDFVGTIRESISLTPEELAAIAKANTQQAKRRPPPQDPRDFGFVIHPGQGSANP